MAVPSSGQLRLRGDIALEVDGSATGLDVSIRALSSSAGKSAPDGMSEFYGYSSATVPSVTTNAMSSVGETTIRLNGNVTSDGNASIIERGFYFGTNSSSPTNNTKIVTGGSTGGYSNNRSGLSTSTTYYCWAFARNSVGTTYGARVSATTFAAYVPTFYTPQYQSGNYDGNSTRSFYLSNDYYNPQTSSWINYFNYTVTNTSGNYGSYNANYLSNKTFPAGTYLRVRQSIVYSSPLYTGFTLYISNGSSPKTVSNLSKTYVDSGGRPISINSTNISGTTGFQAQLGAFPQEGEPNPAPSVAQTIQILISA